MPKPSPQEVIKDAWRAVYDAAKIESYGPYMIGMTATEFIEDLLPAQMPLLERRELRNAHAAFLKVLPDYPYVNVVLYGAFNDTSFEEFIHESVYHQTEPNPRKVCHMIWPGLQSISRCIIAPVIEIQTLIATMNSEIAQCGAIKDVVGLLVLSAPFVSLFHDFLATEDNAYSHEQRCSHYFYENIGHRYIHTAINLGHGLSANDPTTVASAGRVVRLAAALIVGCRITDNVAVYIAGNRFEGYVQRGTAPALYSTTPPPRMLKRKHTQTETSAPVVEHEEEVVVIERPLLATAPQHYVEVVHDDGGDNGDLQGAYIMMRRMICEAKKRAGRDVASNEIRTVASRQQSLKTLSEINKADNEISEALDEMRLYDQPDVFLDWIKTDDMPILQTADMLHGLKSDAEIVQSIRTLIDGYVQANDTGVPFIWTCLNARHVMHEFRIECRADPAFLENYFLGYNDMPGPEILKIYTDSLVAMHGFAANEDLDELVKLCKPQSREVTLLQVLVFLKFEKVETLWRDMECIMHKNKRKAIATLSRTGLGAIEPALADYMMKRRRDFPCNIFSVMDLRDLPSTRPVPVQSTIVSIAMPIQATQSSSSSSSSSHLVLQQNQDINNEDTWRTIVDIDDANDEEIVLPSRNMTRQESEPDDDDEEYTPRSRSTTKRTKKASTSKRAKVTTPATDTGNRSDTVPANSYKAYIPTLSTQRTQPPPMPVLSKKRKQLPQIPALSISSLHDQSNKNVIFPYIDTLGERLTSCNRLVQKCIIQFAKCVIALSDSERGLTTKVCRLIVDGVNRLSTHADILESLVETAFLYTYKRTKEVSRQRVKYMETTDVARECEEIGQLFRQYMFTCDTTLSYVWKLPPRYDALFTLSHPIHTRRLCEAYCNLIKAEPATCARFIQEINESESDWFSCVVFLRLCIQSHGYSITAVTSLRFDVRSPRTIYTTSLYMACFLLVTRLEDRDSLVSILNALLRESGSSDCLSLAEVHQYCDDVATHINQMIYFPCPISELPSLDELQFRQHKGNVNHSISLSHHLNPVEAYGKTPRQMAKIKDAIKKNSADAIDKLSGGRQLTKSNHRTVRNVMRKKKPSNAGRQVGDQSESDDTDDALPIDKDDAADLVRRVMDQSSSAPIASTSYLAFSIPDQAPVDPLFQMNDDSDIGRILAPFVDIAQERSMADLNSQPFSMTDLDTDALMLQFGGFRDDELSILREPVDLFTDVDLASLSYEAIFGIPASVPEEQAPSPRARDTVHPYTRPMPTVLASVSGPSRVGTQNVAPPPSGMTRISSPGNFVHRFSNSSPVRSIVGSNSSTAPAIETRFVPISSSVNHGAAQKTIQQPQSRPAQQAASYSSSSLLKTGTPRVRAPARPKPPSSSSSSSLQKPGFSRTPPPQLSSLSSSPHTVLQDTNTPLLSSIAVIDMYPISENVRRIARRCTRVIIRCAPEYVIRVLKAIRRLFPLLLQIDIDHPDIRHITRAATIGDCIVTTTAVCRITSLPLGVAYPLVSVPSWCAPFSNPSQMAVCWKIGTATVDFKSPETRYRLQPGATVISESPLTVTYVERLGMNQLPCITHHTVALTRAHILSILHPCSGTLLPHTACDVCCSLNLYAPATTCMVACPVRNAVPPMLGDVGDRDFSDLHVHGCDFYRDGACSCQTTFQSVLTRAERKKVPRCRDCTIQLLERMEASTVELFPYCVTSCSRIIRNPYVTCVDREGNPMCIACRDVHPELVPQVRVICTSDYNTSVRHITETIATLRSLMCMARVIIVSSGIADVDVQYMEIVNLMVNQTYDRVTVLFCGHEEQFENRFSHSIMPTPRLTHAQLLDAVFTYVQRHLNTDLILYLNTMCNSIAQRMPEIDAVEMRCDVHAILIYLDRCGMVKYMSSQRVVIISTDEYAKIVSACDNVSADLAKNSVQQAAIDYNTRLINDFISNRAR